jgi:hypothetical protein
MENLKESTTVVSFCADTTPENRRIERKNKSFFIFVELTPNP